MLAFDELVAELGYKDSPHYYTQVSDFGPETAHLFRAAQEIGVVGTYVIQTSPNKGHILPAQPVVYIADVQETDENAVQLKVKEIHRGLWNLCFAPFIILKLPHQIRIYTGFNYSEVEEDTGLLEPPIVDKSQLPQLIKNFSATAIDKGQVWKAYANQIQSNQRVDQHLLTNLRNLGNLLKNDGLHPETANALIGKYVFLSYLRERNILSDTWLARQSIAPESIFSHQATRSSLKQLIEALRDFNGKIFPIDFADDSLQDKHISWVAATFKGDEPSKENTELWQLHLGFKAYDFRYIPVETLSAIYEQFLVSENEKVKQEQGVVYTPEFLADYLLSEVASVKPLQKGMKILDPACGSGIFLVLAYRHLIESLGGETTPEQLSKILFDSIYGIERKRDACYVTEFSLILTLLHYSKPNQLQDLKFKLPDLHNTRIFECDFFDFAGESCESTIWDLKIKFDWIVGNPPWIELKPHNKDEKYVRAWLQDKNNKSSRPTSGNRVAEAFSWVVTDLLKPDGVVGLLLPATSLVNLESQKYRQSFFTQHEVYHITNFANFRDVLFGKKNSGVLPAATFVYRQADENRTKPAIVHYAPFVATQLTTEPNDKPWIITINESEIQCISPVEAEQGETSLWKLALWGTPYDKRTLERLRWLFPQTLEKFCSFNGWGKNFPLQGTEFSNDVTKPIAKITGKKIFDTKAFNQLKPNYRFSIPNESVLQQIERDSHIRRGEDALSLTSIAPHLVLSPGWQDFVIYSDENFIIRPRQMGIAAPNTPENRRLLQALAIYLSSNLVAYYLFFHVPQWGVFSQRDSAVTTKVRQIPTPIFTPEQTRVLADLHQEIVAIEQERITFFVTTIRQQVQKRLNLPFDDFDVEANPGGLPRHLTPTEKRAYEQFVRKLRFELQTKIDETVFEALNIPDDIQQLVKDFMQYRLPLDKSTETKVLIRKPLPDELLFYAQALQNSLDDFAMEAVYHQISITYSDELIECIVELTDHPAPVHKTNIQPSNITMAGLLSELSESLREQVSQWVYVQRGLRLFDGPRIFIYKSPRLIDWTYVRALTDAGDIIASSLMEKWGNREAEPA